VAARRISRKWAADGDVLLASKSGTIKPMALPDHWQPSSDARILAWVGAFATLTAAALWVRNARTRARRSRESR
jgi:hypothetical protein